MAGRSWLDKLHNGEISGEYVIALMERVRASIEPKDPEAMPTVHVSWRVISNRVETFCRGNNFKTHLLAVYYYVLSQESSQQEFVASTIRNAEEQRFYRQQWLPYLVRMTALLNVELFTYPNTELARYAESLSQAWLLQAVLPCAQAELESVKTIALIRSTRDPLPAQ